MMLRKLIWVMICSITIGIAALITGIVISLWIADYSAEPVVFLMVGALVYISVFIIGMKIFFKSNRSNNDKTHRITAYTIGLTLVVSVGLTLLLPLQDEQKELPTVEGQQFWDLPSGLSIAYTHLTSNAHGSLPPIVFLHGGPGVPDMAGDAGYFGQLVQDGYDVYVYDQIGSGRSSRLKDPRDYTVERDVADLEFVRQKIGAEKVILIGHSYGGENAAHYMTAYGNHVEKAVFSSPGAINPEDKSGGNLSKRLNSGEKWILFKSLLYPRVIMTYSLLQINPLAAIKFAGDREMDARFDKVYKYTQPALHAKDLPLGPRLSGLGFYANQTPQSATAKTKPDIRKNLSGMNIPALIIKGSSDYLSWSSGIDYKKALPNSILMYFSNAGHNVYQDQPELFMEVLRAFLSGRPFPIDAYTGLEPPIDYEGVQ